jgi:formylglycine-generating enzyme required for sulfatase activity
MNATTMTKRTAIHVSLALGLVIGVASAEATGPPRFPLRGCGPDAVPAGTACLDKYEASAWRVPSPTTANASLVRRIRLGRATEVDLAAGGATQLGTASDDYAPCTDNGQNCTDDIYAVSLPSVLPAAFITWFQAQAACANSGKRLPTSAEWQVGANGTPDAGPDDHIADCNTADSAASTLTGSRSRCVSARGAFDMVGNLFEWVADWVPLSTDCPNWASFSDDAMCLAGASTSRPGPGALLRGGAFSSGSTAGPLTVLGTLEPSRSGEELVGFRCVR